VSRGHPACGQKYRREREAEKTPTEAKHQGEGLLRRHGIDRESIVRAAVKRKLVIRR